MKILIIEDEPDIRYTLKELLELNGHSVLAAADGPAGVHLAAQHPDLILCDVGLPGLDGFQVITAIQQLPAGAEIPFIFLTARAEREAQRRGMALGADDYITKPFTEREIIDAIAARVRRQKPLRERIEQLLSERQREASANWSHELLTPLNGVLGGLELIEMEAETVSPAELKQLLALIRAGAERQHTLSRKLIRHYELEQARQAPARLLPLRCAAETIVSAAASSAADEPHRQRDLRVDCAPGDVTLSAAYLEWAITELVGNALRFTDRGQPVTVTGRRVGSLYRIEITDPGRGMTPEQRAHVGAFTQFERKDREQQGLGLGLAIARDAALLAGGQLLLGDAPGGPGLRATLELPLVA